MGLVISGGITLDTGIEVFISSYSLGGGVGSLVLSDDALDRLTSGLGSGAILRLKESEGGLFLADFTLNTGASGPFNVASSGFAVLDVSSEISVFPTNDGDCGYYEFRTSGGIVMIRGTNVS